MYSEINVFYIFVYIYRHILYQIEEQLLNKFKVPGMFQL